MREVQSYTSGFWLYCISRCLGNFWVCLPFSKLCPKPHFCLGNIKIHLGFFSCFLFDSLFVFCGFVLLFVLVLLLWFVCLGFLCGLSVLVSWLVF